jgi:flagellar basal-body rod protein FlgC
MKVGSAKSAAVGALVAESTRLAVSAHDVANVSTPAFRPGRVSALDRPGGGGVTTRIEPGGVPVDARGSLHVRARTPWTGDTAERESVLSEVDLGAEVVALTTARRGFEANFATLRVTDGVARALVDTRR